MSTYSITAGSGVILLSTEWNQEGAIGKSETDYNEYCPIDTKVGEKSVTGCSAVALGQVLYYWLQHGLGLNLQVTSDDSYVSDYYDNPATAITINETAASATTYGYLSFSEINDHLSHFTIGDAEDIAALIFASGIIEQSEYSVEATSTVLNPGYFLRVGMAGEYSISFYNGMLSTNPYFVEYDSSTGKYQISEAGYEVLANEILAGRPVVSSLPGHTVVIDGYDAETDSFHINYGWGGHQNGWYSKSEMYDEQFYRFIIDVMPEFEGTAITVTQSGTYGLDTFLRGLEQLQGIVQVDTLNVADGVAGTTLSLQLSRDFDKNVTINGMNSTMTFNESSQGFYNTRSFTFNDLSGTIYVNRSDEYSVLAVEALENVALNDFSGTISSLGLLYSIGIEAVIVDIDEMTGRIISQVNLDTASEGYAASFCINCALLDITDMSGVIKAVADNGQATTVYANGEIDIDGMSGSIEAISESGVAYSIASTDIAYISNVTGAIVAESQGNYAFALNVENGADLENFMGSLVALSPDKKFNACVYSIKDGAVAIEVNSGRLYAGMGLDDAETSTLMATLKQYGEAGRDAMLDFNDNVTEDCYAVYSSAGDDAILIKNYGSLQGGLILGAGEDNLAVIGNSYLNTEESYLYYEGSDIELTVDSTSTLSASFATSKDNEDIMTVNMILTGEESSEAMIDCLNNCYNFVYMLNGQILNLDLRAAVDGTYVLVDGDGAEYYEWLEDISVNVTTADGSFTLSCGSTANNVTLSYENKQLLLNLNGYADASSAQALVFDGDKLISIAAEYSNKTISGDGYDSLRLTSGGRAENIQVAESGVLSVSDNGRANNTVVKAFGFLAVNDGGYACNTTVQANGILNLGLNSTHIGALQIADGAVVNAENSATIDFTINGLEASAYIGINDISKIDGTPAYTLTASSSQAIGNYVLAGNAAAFDASITVKGLSTEHVLDLEENSQFTDGNNIYSLSLNESNELCLAVTPKAKITVCLYLCGDNALESSMIADALDAYSADLTSGNAEIYLYLDRTGGSWSTSFDAMLVAGGNNPWYDGVTINNGAAILKIAYDAASKKNVLSVAKDLEEQNSGSVSALTGFLSWAKKKNENSGIISAQYVLMMAGHGDGIAQSYQDTTSNGSMIPQQISDAIRDSSLGKVDVLVSDASYMANSEAISTLAECADYIVSSENVLASGNFNYGNLLTELDKVDAENITSTEIADIILDANDGEDKPALLKSLSSVAATDALNNALNDFAAASVNFTEQDWIQLAKAFSDTGNIIATSEEYADLIAVLNDCELAKTKVSTTLFNAVKSLKSAAEASVSNKIDTGEELNGGITVFSPLCANQAHLTRYYQFLAMTEAGNDSEWSRFSIKLLQKAIEHEIIEENEFDSKKVISTTPIVDTAVAVASATDASTLYWNGGNLDGAVTLQLSSSNFETALEYECQGVAARIYNANSNVSWRVRNENNQDEYGEATWIEGSEIEPVSAEEKRAVVASDDYVTDIMLAHANGIWSSYYSAKHLGTPDGWEGTGRKVALAGKNKITDTFTGGCSDVSALFLTDDSNGDALFVDDIYSGMPGKAASNARVSQLTQIYAGAGDDIVDLTSQRYEYATVDKMQIHGGDGNDELWAGATGSIYLFGDAGDDVLIGSGEDDVIVGGIGNDTMHGGGGDDIFCFCTNWGKDTIEQLEGGSVTLWFEENTGSWNEANLTYTQGENTVSVIGCSNVTLYFGSSEDAELYAELSADYQAFQATTSSAIYRPQA